MQFVEDYSLKSLNTFGLDVRATTYCELILESDFQDMMQSSHWADEILILGGGSNILFTQDVDRLVIKNKLRGIHIQKEDDDHVWLSVMAGENWHSLVLYSLKHGLGGIENLSLIPGSVGAAPMQNIGAYGVELKQVFHSLRAVNLSTGEIETFDNEQCAFGYRESVFKTRLKNKYFIIEVTLKLTRRNHKLSLDYGAIKEILESSGVDNPGISDISNAVISIRKSKLPDPAIIGNAGSFFKNPVVDKIDFEGLRLEFPSIPGYEISPQKVKLPAGWLIDQCGWKGQKRGFVGVHKKQALVLVNYGGGNGAAIVELADEIKESVAQKFGVELQTEVNIL